MILFYIVMVLVSAMLAVMTAEYQACYQKKQKFSLQNIREHFMKMPVPFLVFVIVYVTFTVIAVLHYQEKGLHFIQLPQYVIFWEGMLAGAWIDFRTKKIPNVIFLILLAVRCAGILAEMAFLPENIFQILLTSFSGMLVGGIILLLCKLLSRGGIGAGDVKMFALIGFNFGMVVVMNILFYTTFLAAFVAMFLLISRKAKMKSTLALGPFVFIGLNIYYILLSNS